MTKLDADLFLVRAVREGDEAAWSQLIDRYQGRLISFARRMLAASSDAEDVVQETFIGLLRSLENYDEGRSLETYLFAILRNKLHDQFRKAKTQQRTSLESIDVTDGEPFTIDRNTPSRYVEGAESLEVQRQVLVDAMRTWVETCRAQNRFQELVIVEMLLVLGLRNKEVAADLDLTETAVAGDKFRVQEQWNKVTAEAALQHTWNEAELAK
ncbi:MAG: RNA polymerase sigma factor, partial [Phycisphaerae bacterium]